MQGDSVFCCAALCTWEARSATGSGCRFRVVDVLGCVGIPKGGNFLGLGLRWDFGAGGWIKILRASACILRNVYYFESV